MTVFIELRKARGRQPAGAPGGKGGEFAPSGSSAPSAAGLRAAGIGSTDIKDVTRVARRSTSSAELETKIGQWGQMRNWKPEQFAAVRSYALSLQGAR